jgi:hypothetical protein
MIEVYISRKFRIDDAIAKSAQTDRKFVVKSED